MKPGAQEHSDGEMQLPPLSHPVSQTAEIEPEYSVENLVFMSRSRLFCIEQSSEIESLI